MATEQFIIDVSVRGAKGTAADVKRIGTTAQAVRKTLAFLRSALVAVAAIRVFGNLVSDLAAFSDAMAEAKAVTGATGEEFDKLRNIAKELGATTRFTAGEAAEGITFLGRAGFDTNEILATLPDTLNLASAGLLDLGRAADIASNVLTAFGLDVLKTNEVVDTLVFTANNSNTSVTQLADALKLVAPVASGLGIPLQEVSAQLAILGDNGIQASLAGTGLRRILTDLEAPTGSLLKILKGLNIPLDQVRPSVVGLTGALERLREANVGASLASLAFGKRGGFVAAALLRDIEEVKAFEESFVDAANTGEETAQTIEQSLGGSFRALRSAIQAVIIAIGDVGAEQFLTDFFFGLAEAFRAVARNIDNVVAALKVFIVAIGIRKIIEWVAAIGRAREGIRSLGVAIRANPLGLLLTGLTLVISGLTAFQSQINLTADGAVKLEDAFTAAGDIIGTQLVDAFNAAGNSFKNFDELLEDNIRKTAQGLQGVIAVFNGLLEAVKLIFRKIAVAIKKELFGIQAEIFRFQTGVNRVAQALGAAPLFDVEDNKKELRELNQEIIALGDTSETVGDAFLRGGREFLRATEVAAEARRKAEAEREQALVGGVPGPDKPAFPGIRPEDVPGLLDGADDTIKDLTDALRDLEASVSPLLAAQDNLAEAQKIINDAVAEGIELRIDEQELLKRVRRDQLGAAQTAEQQAEAQEVLNQALKDGVINLEEFQRLSAESRIGFLEEQTGFAAGFERAFLKLQQDATDTAAFTEMVFTDAFRAIEDAVIQFVETGKFNLDDFFRNFAQQLIRLGTQQAIAGFGGFFGGQFGAAGPTGTQAGVGGLVAALLPQLLGGFQRGGSFTVGANTAAQSLPGIDNRLVAFRARDGEDVTVTPRDAQAGAMQAPTNIVFNVQARDADSFVRSQSQLQNRLLAGIGQARRKR